MTLDELNIFLLILSPLWILMIFNAGVEIMEHIGIRLAMRQCLRDAKKIPFLMEIEKREKIFLDALIDYKNGKAQSAENLVIAQDRLWDPITNPRNRK